MNLVNLARPARLAGSVWELARFALLLSATARLSGGQMARIVPLLVPLAAPGLVIAAGLAAGALLPEARAGLEPLLRLGKLLEVASATAALGAALLAGTPAGAPLVLLLATAAVVDLLFLLLLLSSDRRAERPSL